MVGRPKKADTKLFRYLDNLSKLFVKHGYDVIHIPCPEGFDHLIDLFRIQGGQGSSEMLKSFKVPGI